jgi:hypothetical protein
VQTSLHAASTRLEQLNATLVQLSTLSTEKAELERAKGTSCPNSKPGDGPRRKMREDDAARFSFASEFVKGRVGAVNGDLAALNGDLALISKDDKSIVDAKSGTRNEFMKALSRKLEMTVTGFNAFRTDPQLKQLRADLDARAEQSTFGDPKKGGFVCPDAQLQQALRGAVRAIDQLPELRKPEIAAVEGSEATIEAFRRLTATFYGLLSFKMPPSADELRDLQKKAVQSVEGGAQRPLSTEGAGLSKRDYVPLAIALFVDLCLLLVSMGRPMHRLNGLVPKMREAERGPVIQILSRFNDIHRDPEIRQNFDLFRHVVFDYHGDYYVAVPLDAPKRMNPEERLELQHEAHLLANLFSSFEKERIFKRIYNPMLSTSSVQKRLRRQGSKFAECDAFRTYRFRDGAWSEIILGAVMGAAKRVEAAKKRYAREDEIIAAARIAAAMPGQGDAPTLKVPRPVVDPEPTLERSRREPRPDDVKMPESVRNVIRGAAAGAARKPATARSQTVRPEFASSYGPYGHLAQSELNADGIETDAEVAARAANSNTAPSARRPLDRASEGMSQPAASETVVPFNGARPRLAPRSPVAYAEPVLPPAASAAAVRQPLVTETQLELLPEVGGKIGVVLSRETATLSVPAGEAGFSEEPISRLGRALSDSKAIEAEGDTIESAVKSEAPLQITQHAEEDLEAEVEITEVDADPTHDDAVSIAGRLRPAIPAE